MSYNTKWTTYNVRTHTGKQEVSLHDGLQVFTVPVDPELQAKQAQEDAAKRTMDYLAERRRPILHVNNPEKFRKEVYMLGATEDTKASWKVALGMALKLFCDIYREALMGASRPESIPALEALCRFMDEGKQNSLLYEGTSLVPSLNLRDVFLDYAHIPIFAEWPTGENTAVRIHLSGSDSLYPYTVLNITYDLNGDVKAPNPGASIADFIASRLSLESLGTAAAYKVLAANFCGYEVNDEGQVIPLVKTAWDPYHLLDEVH